MYKCIFVFLSFFFCSAAFASGSIAVSKEGYKGDWPFSVDRGELSCLDGVAVVFKANGVMYAVNGMASSRGYKDIEPIWLEDPSLKEMAAQIAESNGESVDDVMKQMGGPLRISIHNITQDGLALCDK